MTIGICISICWKKGFVYAGLQWKIECYCGHEPKQSFKWAWKDKCIDRCAGNLLQICGGSNSMSLYSIPRIINGLCIESDPSNRIFNEILVTRSKTMTIENCRIICQGLFPFDGFI